MKDPLKLARPIIVPVRPVLPGAEFFAGADVINALDAADRQIMFMIDGLQTREVRSSTHHEAGIIARDRRRSGRTR